MALAAGAGVGPYENIAPLGAGGMGEVYRAHDTKLKRDVGVEGFGPALASEREAQVLASLNHPNIASIYGVEGAYNIDVKRSSGAGGEELLFKSNDEKDVPDRLRDGKVLLYSNLDRKTGVDLMALALEEAVGAASRKPFPVARTEFSEGEGKFSPDGRRVVYCSNETGRYEIYV